MLISRMPLLFTGTGVQVGPDTTLSDSAVAVAPADAVTVHPAKKPTGGPQVPAVTGVPGLSRAPWVAPTLRVTDTVLGAGAAQLCGNALKL